MNSLADRHLRGVSLIEALVAMAIMAFGMLAIVGVQSTLRLNNETARQRSEAVRLAQQAAEDDRSFVEVTAPVAGTPNYSSIVNQAQTINPGAFQTLAGLALPALNSSASYQVTTTITETGLAANSEAPRMKAVMVQADWNDRTWKAGDPPSNSVMLYTTIARIAPAIAGSLGIAADVGVDGVATIPMRPGGRNAIIPSPAVDFGDGTSGYVPPGGGGNGDGAAWLFNNKSGLITICTTVVASNNLLNSSNQLSCAGGATAYLLTGTVDFAKVVDGLAATAGDAINPSGPPFAVQVGFSSTFPAGANAICYTTAPVLAVVAFVSYVDYACAVPVSSISNPAMVWSGYSYVTGVTVTWNAGGYSVCRYTLPTQVADALVTSGAITNGQHPRTYYRVGRGLSNQNFLIVPVVSGTATDCPSGAPLPANVKTYPQPAALQASAPA